MLVKLLLSVHLATLFLGGADRHPAQAISMPEAVSFLSTQVRVQQPVTIPPETKLLRPAVRQEVRRTFRITTPILNTWLVILLMSSTAMTLAIWLRFSQLAWQAKGCSQEIDSLKYDALSRVRYLTLDAETAFQELQESLEISKEKIAFMSSDSALETEELFDNEPQGERRS